MSLIFEALKKLDREKKAPERGFLVVGGAAPDVPARLRTPVLLLALAAAGGAGFLAARALRPATAPAPAAAPPPVTTVTAAVPRLAPPVPLPPESRAETAPSPSAAQPGAATATEAPREAARVAPVPETPAATPAAPVFALEAVADQEGHPVAIVNGQLVRVGDLVDGARVVRIAPEQVELDHGGRRVVLVF